MSSNSKKHDISLEAVTFYLDGVERNRLDTSGPGGKAGEAIAIRDQLLKLSDEAFHSAIKTMKALIVEASDNKNVDGRTSDQEARGAARKLYDESRSTRGSGTRGTLGKVTGS
jgi:hypothetical protein